MRQPHCRYYFTANCSLRTLSSNDTPFQSTQLFSAFYWIGSLSCPAGNLSTLLDFTYRIGCSYDRSFYYDFEDATTVMTLVPGSLLVNSSSAGFASCVMSNLVEPPSNEYTFTDRAGHAVLCRAPTATPAPTVPPPPTTTVSPTFSPSSALDKRLTVDFTQVPNPIVEDYIFGGYRISNNASACTPSPATPACVSCDSPVIYLGVLWIMAANCSMRTQTLTTNITSGFYLFWTLPQLYSCSSLQAPLDANMTFDMLVGCEQDYDSGEFVASFSPDWSTLKLSSTASPEFADCVAAERYAFDFTNSFTLDNGDNVRCVANLTTPAPSPRTFGPTTAAQASYTLDFSHVETPLMASGGAEALFGAYETNLSACVPSPQRPACLRCSKAYVGTYFNPAQFFYALCYLETTSWSTLPLNLSLFAVPAVIYTAPCVWQARLGAQLEFAYTLGCSYSGWLDDPVVAVQVSNASLVVNATDPLYGQCVMNQYTWGQPITGFLFNATEGNVLCTAPTFSPSRSPSGAPSRAPTTTSSPVGASTSAFDVPLVAGAAAGGAVAALALLALLLMALRHRQKRRVEGEDKVNSEQLSSRKAQSPQTKSELAASNPGFQV